MGEWPAPDRKISRNVEERRRNIHGCSTGYVGGSVVLFFFQGRVIGCCCPVVTLAA